MSHPFFRNVSLVVLAAFPQLAAVAASAVELEPFVCNDGSFIVQDPAAKLFDGDDFDPVICPDLGSEINNLGYRSSDGFLYAIKLTAGGNDGVVRIGRGPDGSCAAEPLGSWGLPDDERFDAGAFSTDGTTFYVHAGGTDHLYVVDLNGPPATSVIYFPATGNVHDWAYFPGLDPAQAVLFGATTDGHVARLEIGPVIRTDSTSAILPAGFAYGGARFDAAGKLVVYNNDSGAIFKIDVSGFPDPVVDLESSGRASTRNDATWCPIEPCDEAYIMQQTAARLYRTDTSKLSFDPPIEICSPFINTTPPPNQWRRENSAVPLTPELNNMCFHKADRLIYALELTPDGNSGLVRFDPDTCELESMDELTGLPAGERFDAGDCWGDVMLVNLGGVHTKFYRLDLGSLAAEPVMIKKAVQGANYTGYVHDWAYNPVDGKLYGGDNSEGQLARLEIVQQDGQWVGLRQDRNLMGTALPAGDAYGGAWFNADGHLVLHQNDTGELFEIDVASRQIVDGKATAFDSDKNDGASCVAGSGQ